MSFAPRVITTMLVTVAAVLGSGCGVDGGVDRNSLPAVELTALDGSGVDSASLTGEPMVINFWFSTCPPCAAELGDFAEVHAEVGDEVRFIGVNPIDDAARMESFAADRGVEYELYGDRTGELQDRLGITSFPATLFVDADGTVVHLEGVLDADALRFEIDELLAGGQEGLDFSTADDVDQEWNGIRRQPAPDVFDAPLPALDSGSLSLRPDAGRATVVYFGFTNCPDVCPTTMADLTVALRSLEERASLVDVVMISVDPERDAEHLDSYVKAFVPTGRAVATEDADLLAASAEPFGASWDVRTLSDGSIEVDHTPFLYLVGEDGRLAVTWPFGTSGPHIADDLTQLLDNQLDHS